MSPRLFDGFTFYDELDLLELRLAEIGDLVDRFVLVEATSTFQGGPKPLVFNENKARFGRWLDKIEHVVIDFPDPIPALSRKSRSKDKLERAKAWDREYYQRDQILRGFSDAAADDIVMVSDVDEIPRRDVIERIIQTRLYERNIVALGMAYYRFFLNCKVAPPKTADPEVVASAKGAASVRGLEFGWKPEDQQWNGLHLAQRRYVTSPSDLRRARIDPPKAWARLGLGGLGLRVKNRRFCGMANPVVVVPDAGWHFSSLGGYDGWLKKVQAFSHTEYRNTAEFKDQAAFQAWFAMHQIVGLEDLPEAVRAAPSAWAAYLYLPPGDG
jgi:beta-1,4-mannosyl-glycoprotein beta-1,4-N-acetylglucosaminyltransferase